MNEILADLVVWLHLGFVFFVILGFVSVPLGAWRSWEWVRGRGFRVLHLLAIGFVALEALIGVTCPLTWLEYQLLGRGEGSFMGRMARSVLYYDFPPWVFTAVYVALALLALLLWRAVPPRRAGGR